MSDTFAVEQSEGSGGLRRGLTVLFKYKTMILTVIAVTAGLVTVAALILPADYVAKSSILVKIGREYMNNPEVGESKNQLAVNLADMVNAEIQILTNRELADRVVKTLRVEKLYPALAGPNGVDRASQDKAVDRFQRNLQVEGIRNSSVIQVSFHHSNPRVAVAAVELLVELYKEKHLQVFSTPRSLFLDQQLTAYTQQLKASEDKLEAFKQRTRVFALEEQRTLLLQQRMNLDSSLKDAQNRVDELGKKLATLTHQNKLVIADRSLNSQGEPDRVLADVKTRLITLQLEEQQLLKKYTVTSRMVTDIRKEIELVQKQIRALEDEQKGRLSAGNIVAQQVRLELIKTEAELNSQKARVATLRGQLGQVDREVVAIDQHAKEFQNLRREVATTEKNYQAYLGKAEEARLSEDMNQQKLVNLSVIQPAAVPAEPASKKKLLIILFGSIGGIVLGVGSAFLLEKLSQGIATPERAEKLLGLPVLASISFSESR